ncbi:DUF6207 family protein [Streptomyces coeruleorubidus]
MDPAHETHVREPGMVVVDVAARRRRHRARFPAVDPRQQLDS